MREDQESGRQKQGIKDRELTAHISMYFSPGKEDLLNY